MRCFVKESNVIRASTFVILGLSNLNVLEGDDCVLFLLNILMLICIIELVAVARLYITKPSVLHSADSS